MPDESTPVTPAAAATPAPAAVVTEAPAGKEPQGEPSFLPDRLKRERRATLKKLGIDVPRDASDLDMDKAIDEFKSKAKGRKDKTKALVAEKETAQQRAEALADDSATLKTYADLELGRLDEPTRELVKKLAGDSPSAQLKQIEMMKALTPKADPAKPAMAPPAQTAPNATVPPTTQATPANKREEYLRVRGQNPYLAAQFLLDHRFEIFQQK